MGQPASRLGDMHVCPMVTPGLPPIPHVGGPIVSPGAPTRRLPAVYGDHARPSPDGKEVLFVCDFYDNYDGNLCRYDENDHLKLVRD